MNEHQLLKDMNGRIQKLLAAKIAWLDYIKARERHGSIDLDALDRYMIETLPKLEVEIDHMQKAAAALAEKVESVNIQMQMNTIVAECSKCKEWIDVKVNSTLKNPEPFVCGCGHRNILWYNFDKHEWSETDGPEVKFYYNQLKEESC